jgi:hypothetical protein
MASDASSIKGGSAVFIFVHSHTRSQSQLTKWARHRNLNGVPKEMGRRSRLLRASSTNIQADCKELYCAGTADCKGYGRRVSLRGIYDGEQLSPCLTNFTLGVHHKTLLLDQINKGWRLVAVKLVR